MKAPSFYGWIELLEGMLLIVCGFITIRCPDAILSSLVILYGVIAVVIGIGETMFYCKLEEHIGFIPVISLLSSILCTMFGFCLIAHPHIGLTVFMILFPVWFIIQSISRLSHVQTLCRFAGKGILTSSLIANILCLVLGIVMLFYPRISVISAGILIGAALIIIGLEHSIIGLSDLGSRW